MIRFALPLAFVIAVVRVSAAEPVSAAANVAPSVTSPAVEKLPTLAEIEAQPKLAPADPNYWAAAEQTTQQVLNLIDRNGLPTADEFVRAAQCISPLAHRYRANRVRYELLLSAAALNHADAAKQLATEWDNLLASLSRPLRTDFAGLAQKQPESFTADLATASVLAVLRDPEKARLSAKTAGQNAEIKTIVDADQKDRRSDWSKLTPDERTAIGERDHIRNRRTREIMQAGELHTAADFANAALVMQHSGQFSGYQIAHELAVCAMLLGDRGLGRWLIAATYDRMLGSVGHDQRFGTQYNGYGSAAQLVTLDPQGICDAERKALGCPTLDEARNRALNPPKPAAKPALVAELIGPNHTVHDPQFGLAATYPANWELQAASRWGEQQQTIFFEITGDPEPRPNFYYRVYLKPRPLTHDALVAFVHTEVEKKQIDRRDQFGDYTNRPDSFMSFVIGAYPAFSWWADFTSPTGEKWAEYFVRFQTDFADASFFLQAPANQIEALRPAVDQFMAGLKMPEPKK